MEQVVLRNYRLRRTCAAACVTLTDPVKYLYSKKKKTFNYLAGRPCPLSQYITTINCISYTCFLIQNIQLLHIVKRVAATKYIKAHRLGHEVQVLCG